MDTRTERGILRTEELTAMHYQGRLILVVLVFVLALVGSYAKNMKTLGDRLIAEVENQITMQR